LALLRCAPNACACICCACSCLAQSCCAEHLCACAAVQLLLLLLPLLLLLQAVVALHPGWRLTNIWEFPRIHMAHTPQVNVTTKANHPQQIADL
jgi:hypothetical protein